MKLPTYELENKHGGIVIGIDEVGYGPWAGPVVACAAWINPCEINEEIIPLIRDSKTLSEKQRLKVCEYFKSLSYACFKFSIGVSDVNEINEFGIKKSTFMAMTRAYNSINLQSNCVLIDGINNLDLNCKTIAIPKGDNLSITIAAASIIAKTYRDNVLRELDKEFPQYNWRKNVGYGTKEHITAIENFGVTIHHRKSFKPIIKFLNSG